MSLVNCNGGALARRPRKHGGVRDLLWDVAKCLFGLDLIGSLPDVRIPNSSVEDWQAVLGLVVEKGWKCQYSEGETVLAMPRAQAVLSRNLDNRRSMGELAAAALQPAPGHQPATDGPDRADQQGS